MDTKLHEAVRYGDVDSVLAALKEGFDPNAVGLLKWTPVQEAARAGERDILFHLLNHGGTALVFLFVVLDIVSFRLIVCLLLWG